MTSVPDINGKSERCSKIFLCYPKELFYFNDHLPMYIVQIIVFILLIITAESHDKTLLLNDDIEPCLSQSLEKIFFEYKNEQYECSSLPSEIQTKLAIHFTFCHLNSTGVNPKAICNLSLADQYVNQCLKNITKNSFAYLTYTNFIPHIQSICYAIETQQWHSHAKDVVLQINKFSSQLESETKKLLIEQETMQTNLDHTLRANQESVDNALSVDRYLQIAQSDVDELRGDLYVKDKAQIELIQQVMSWF